MNPSIHLFIQPAETSFMSSPCRSCFWPCSIWCLLSSGKRDTRGSTGHSGSFLLESSVSYTPLWSPDRCMSYSYPSWRMYNFHRPHCGISSCPGTGQTPSSDLDKGKDKHNPLSYIELTGGNVPLRCVYAYEKLTLTPGTTLAWRSVAQMGWARQNRTNLSMAHCSATLWMLYIKSIWIC